MDVYTDDSDPLAAAIHSGWVKGHWGPDIDADMLEITPASSASQASLFDREKQSQSSIMISSVPPQPMEPVPGKDLHLTLVVMPSLEAYASKIMHGIKSRPWGSNHDGMSFRIEALSWVDEGDGGGEERGGEAKRRRLRSLGRRGLMGKVVIVGGGAFGGKRGESREVGAVGA